MKHSLTFLSRGCVTLVGAGPGDPELLTLKAARAIANATVILVDDLVHPDVLLHAQPSARVVPVGKRGGCASTAQTFIEHTMIEQAQQGEIVVRLKGGDPLVFGRAGEELAALEAAGVRCSVINGITSGMAAAGSLGVSLTHREHAHGVVMVTGHAAAHGIGTDWVRLGEMVSQLQLTLVIYMGSSQARSIQEGLLAHCAPSTHVALIESASTAHERRRRTSLDQLAHTIEQEKLGSPLIILVGSIAACKEAACRQF